MLALHFTHSLSTHAMSENFYLPQITSKKHGNIDKRSNLLIFLTFSSHFPHISLLYFPKRTGEFGREATTILTQGQTKANY